MQDTRDLLSLMDLHDRLEPYPATTRLAAFEAALSAYSSRTRPPAYVEVARRLHARFTEKPKGVTRGKSA
jgi:hypothetical protein